MLDTQYISSNIISNWHDGQMLSTGQRSITMPSVQFYASLSVLGLHLFPFNVILYRRAACEDNGSLNKADFIYQPCKSALCWALETWIRPANPPVGNLTVAPLHLAVLCLVCFTLLLLIIHPPNHLQTHYTTSSVTRHFSFHRTWWLSNANFLKLPKKVISPVAEDDGSCSRPTTPGKNDGINAL